MRHPIFCAAIVGILSSLVLGSVGASSVCEDKAELSDLVAGAERICEVEVLSAESAMLADGSIETRYSFSTLTPIKGTMTSIQEIRMPGGEVAGRGFVLPGMPDLRVGDRSILFLSQASQENQWRMPVGLESGAVKVLPSTVAGEAQVIRRGHERGQVETQDYDRYIAEIFAEVQRQS
ncbi:MAG: hypothetical protein QF489_02430 [Planctomycetota bacterium]|jgi:hypothetical protein|nr:hypothetical protein [Planctomycetota bacterium]